jgi:hypothetical protein
VSSDWARISHASDSLSFEICNTHNARVRPTRFNSSPKLREEIQRLQDELTRKVSKYNNLPNTVKGELGVLRDLAAIEAIGVGRGAVSKTIGKGYDIHGFKRQVGIQIESKNVKPATTLSGYWIKREVLDRFPRNEDSEAGSRHIVRVLVIPAFTPHGQKARRMSKLMKKRGINVILVDEQALNVEDALRFSKAVESQLREILSRFSVRDDLF